MTTPAPGDTSVPVSTTEPKRFWGPAQPVVALLSWLLTMLGLGIAVYMTIVHFSTVVPLVCSDKGFVNCAKVTTSPQSYFLGIPVAVLGLAFFVPMVALCSPWGWRSTHRIVHIARQFGVLSGMAFVLWLVSAELLIIGSICLWCTGVHITTFALLVCVTSQAGRVFAGSSGNSE